jgi:hypothetical protein
MAFASALLKPAALLVLGASSVLGSAAAHAVTYYFGWSSNYTGINSGTTRSFSGSGTLAATQLVAGDFTQWQITRIWGTWNSGTITGLITEIDTNPQAPPPFIEPIDNKFTTSDFLTLQNFNALTEFGFGWTTANTQYNVYKNLSTQQNNAFVNFNNLKYSPNDTTPFNITIIPAPLPILALPAVFYYSRKIKKRMKQCSLAPIAD